MDLESDTESDISTPEVDESGRKVHGLLKSYHGIVYQLQWLMVVALQSQKPNVDYGFTFKTEVEETDAGKFDDVVWRYCDGQQIKYIFLQSKHKLNSSEKITLNELLKKGEKGEKNNPFSLQKYFVSYKKHIKKDTSQEKKKYKDGVIENLIVATNIDFEKNLKSVFEIIRIKNPIIRVLQRKGDLQSENLQCWKINIDSIPCEIKSRFEETYDLVKLAKTLGDHVRSQQPFKLSDDLKPYHKAIYDNIVDEKENRLSDNFIIGNNLSKQGEFLRQAFLHIEFENKRAFSVSGHKIIPNPTAIAKTLSELIRDSKNNIIKIDRRNNIFNVNIDALSNYILIEDDGVKFNNRFWKVSDSDLPNDSIKIFRKVFIKSLRNHNLINDKKDTLTVIAQKFDSYRFDIRTFKTCRKELVDETSFWDTVRSYNGFQTKHTTQTPKEKEVKGLPDYSLNDINNEIIEFLDLLIFAVTCSKKRLNLLIEKEMKETFKFIENEYMAYVFRTEIAKSLDLTEDNFISSSKGVSEFLNTVKNHINSFILIGPTLEYQVKTDIHRVKFGRQTTNKFKLRNFIANTKEQILVINTVNVKLSSMKILQIIKLIPSLQFNGAYIFMEIDTIVNLLDLVISVFSSTSNLLIIESNTVANRCDFNLEELFEKISNTLNMSTSKKIIVITSENNVLIQNLKDNNDKHRVKEISDKFNNIMNLSQQSRDNILDKARVFLQGDKISLKRLIVDEIKYLIKNDLLFKVLNGDDIYIGEIVTDLGEISDYYIPRHFYRSNTIKKAVLKENNVFAISNINHLHFSQELTKHIKISDNNAVVLYHEKSLNNANIDKYVILDEKYAPQQFSNLCNKFPSKTIHWLKYDSERFIWQKSHGSLDNLRKYFYDEKFECGEKENNFVHKIKLKNTLLLAAEPGMGKSTILTKLSSLLKIDMICWVLRVNLLHFSSDFKRPINEDFVIEFLYKASNFNFLKLECYEQELSKILKDTKIQNGKISLKYKQNVKCRDFFEIEIFNYLFNKGKVFIFLDGFDEICSAYEQQVLKLVKILKNTMMVNIIITTRPYNVLQNIENLLGDFAYKLKPFDSKDQTDFLIQYWQSNFEQQQKVEKERANVFINELLGEFSKVASDPDRDFVSIPLQLRMLADSFQIMFYEFYKSTVPSINNLYKTKIKSKLDLLKLYEDFLITKFEKIRFQEKKPGSNPDDADMVNIRERELQKFISDHRKLAIYTLFRDNNITEVLSKADIFDVKVHLLKNVKKANEKNGIIYDVINDLPVFVHRTFAEYFASSYFWEIFKKTEFSYFKNNYMPNAILKILFSGNNLQICRFFNLMAKNDLLGRHPLNKSFLSVNFQSKTEKISFLLESLTNVVKRIYDEYENGGTDQHNGTNDIQERYGLENSCFNQGYVPSVKLLFKIVEYYLQDNKSDNNEICAIIKRNTTINLLRIAAEVGCLNFTTVFLKIGHLKQDYYEKELNRKKWYFTPIWFAAKNHYLPVVNILSNVYNLQWTDKDRYTLKQRVFSVNEYNVLDSCLTLRILDGSPFNDANHRLTLPLIHALKTHYSADIIKKILTMTDTHDINEFDEPNQLPAPLEMVCCFLKYDDDILKFAISSGISFDGVINLLLYEYSYNSLNDPIFAFKHAYHFKCSFFTHSEFPKLYNVIEILLQSGVPFNTQCTKYKKFSIQYAEGIYDIHKLFNLLLNYDRVVDTITKLFLKCFPNVNYEISYVRNQIWVKYGENYSDKLFLIPENVQEFLSLLPCNKLHDILQNLHMYIETAKEEIIHFKTYSDNKTYNNILTGYEEMIEYGHFKCKKQKLSLLKSLNNLIKFLLQETLKLYIRQDYDILDAYNEISTKAQKAVRLFEWMQARKKIETEVSTNEILYVLGLNDIKISIEMQKRIVNISKNMSINFLNVCWSNLNSVGDKKIPETIKSIIKYIDVSSKINSLLLGLNDSYKKLSTAVLSENYDKIIDILNVAEPYTKSLINGQNAEYGSPLHYAIYKGNIKLIKILLSYGANTNVRLESHNSLMSNLSNEVNYSDDGNYSDTYFYGNDENYEGFSSLHLAVVKGDPDIVQLLINYGGDSKIKNKSEENCLQIAYNSLAPNNKHYQKIIDILNTENEKIKHKISKLSHGLGDFENININETYENMNMDIDDVIPSTSTSTRKRKAEEVSDSYDSATSD